MNKRYFYTDNLEAAYMRRHHGFMLANESGDAYSDFESLPRIYVRKESEKLLERRQGDVIDASKGDGSYLVGSFYNPSEKDLFIMNIFKERGTPITPWRIIQRAGRAFFMPQVEEVTV